MSLISSLLGEEGEVFLKLLHCVADLAAAVLGVGGFSLPADHHSLFELGCGDLAEVLLDGDPAALDLDAIELMNWKRLQRRIIASDSERFDFEGVVDSNSRQLAEVVRKLLILWIEHRAVLLVDQLQHADDIVAVGGEEWNRQNGAGLVASLTIHVGVKVLAQVGIVDVHQLPLFHYVAYDAGSSRKADLHLRGEVLGWDDGPQLALVDEEEGGPVAPKHRRGEVDDLEDHLHHRVVFLRTAKLHCHLEQVVTGRFAALHAIEDSCRVQLHTDLPGDEKRNANVVVGEGGIFLIVRVRVII